MDQWWTLKNDNPKAVASALENTFKGLEDAQRSRLMDYVVYANLYGNVETTGFGPHEYANTSVRSRADKMAVNLIHNMVDTVVSKLCAPRIKATFLTEKGDYLLQRKAKKLEDVVHGILYENDFMFLDSQVIKDAAIFGIGLVKVVAEDSRVCIERVLPNEVFVDNAEALYGRPQCMYQVRYVSRDALIAAFPEHREAILNVKAETEYTYTPRELSDVVKVVEAWKIGASGRHVMATGDVTLLDDRYTKDWFPFAHYVWNPRVAGFYGEGLAEQLVPIQLELNKLLRRVQLSQHLMSVPYMLVENGSKVNKAQLNNEVGHIVNYTGRAPVPVVGQAMHPEVYQHIDRLIRWAYEVAGVSQMSAQSKKPVGLDSAPALRTFHDIESERFQLVSEMHERFVLQVAKLVVKTAQGIRNFKVKGVNKKFFEEVNWKDVDLEESDYVLKLHPTSMLPTTPSARLQKVGEMFRDGMLTPVEAMKLLDFPDVEAATAKKTAQLDLIQLQLAEMEEFGKYIAPEPFQNLQMCLEEATSYYIQLKIKHAPESTLSLFRKFIRACDDKLSAVAMAAQGVNPNVPAAASTGAPIGPAVGGPGVPGPAPTIPPVVG